MNAVGRIGVIIPDIYDSLEQELTEGIYVQAKSLGYDVLVFCDTCNPLPEYRHFPEIMGYENIYRLPLMAELDGILFCASRFLDTECRSMIYDSLEKLSIPCLVIGEKTIRFPFVISSQEESIYQLTKHLLETHHCRKLYCLTGYPDETNSTERVEGFCRALKEAGIQPDESMVFYGDFWKQKPRQLGLDIAQGRIEKPDAVVCTSDVMAVSLCEALTENGISVPEDIVITGYDGRWEAVMSAPSITTMIGRERQLGFTAVCSLYRMMKGHSCEAVIPKQQIRYGTSCGCLPDSDRNIEEYIINMMNRCNEQKIYISMNSMYHITKSVSMQELMNTIYGFSFLLHPVVQYAICLCEDWQFDFENTAVFREQGFSERMIVALERTAENTPKMGTAFLRKDLLPDLQSPHEPQLKVFISLHHEAQIFGYIALTYREAQMICLDDHLMHWCNTVANGLNTLQKVEYQSYVRQQLEALSVIDPATGFFNKRGLLEQLPKFSSRSANTDQSYISMFISYVQRSSISARLGGEPALMIANALRLSSTENELLCRLQDHVFAVILSISGGRAEQLVQERIMRLEEKIRYMQDSVPQLPIPELVTDYGLMQFDQISKAGAFIEEKQQSVLQKAEVAAITNGNYKERLRQLRREIHASPQKDWGISDMAQSIGISSSHFHRMYKLEFGVSCKDDVIAARIEKAKQLLQGTNLRVQEIAGACGYSDCSHFMRQFKNKVGVSALQYRKQKPT